MCQYYYNFHFTQKKQSTEVFCKKGILRNFAKFTGKHLCQRLLFNKVASLGLQLYQKKSLWHRCLPVNFVKFLRTYFFTEHLWATASDSTKSINKTLVKFYKETLILHHFFIYHICNLKLYCDGVWSIKRLPVLF